MDMMLLGELVNTRNGYKGFWMPAGGNNGVGGVEVFLNTAAGTADIVMETKKSDEDDAAAVTIGSVTISAVTVTSPPQSYNFDLADAKDLVRYTVVGSHVGLLHLQFAQPLWQPN